MNKKLEEIVKSINEIVKSRNELLSKIRKDGETALKETFKEVFDEFPELKSIRWTQYTPYWCDGGACFFRVNEFQYSISSENDEEEYLDTYNKTPLAKAIRKIEESIPEEILEEVFGDHVEVMVTREGIEVREYEHD